MNQKKLTKTIYNDFKLKKPFGFHGLNEIIAALQGLKVYIQIAKQLNYMMKRLKVYAISQRHNILATG